MKHYKLKTGLFLMLIFFSTKMNAQFSGIETVGTAGAESSPFTAQTSDGGIVLVCASQQAGQNTRLLVRKTNQDGSEAWRNLFRDTVVVPNPDLIPVAIISDNLPDHSHEIYILANAQYNNTGPFIANNDIYFIKLDGITGAFLGSRRITIDSVKLGLPANHRNTLIGYSMIQLMNGDERGDILVAANLAAMDNNTSALVNPLPKNTQLLYKMRPNLSMNWGRQFCNTMARGAGSFGTARKNATQQLLELPNGHILMGGHHGFTTDGSTLELLTEIVVTQDSPIIVSNGGVRMDKSYFHPLGGNFSAHCMTRNFTSGHLYTSYYGPTSTTSVFMINEFDGDTLRYMNRKYVTIPLNTSGTVSGKLLYVSPTNLLFVTTYTQGGIVRNVLGSINPSNSANWTINWAKTFNLANIQYLSWEITMLNNGNIMLKGIYNNAGNNDVVLITTKNGPANLECEFPVTMDVIDPATTFVQRNLKRNTDECEKPIWWGLAKSNPVIYESINCGCPFARTNAFVFLNAATISQTTVYSGKYYVPDSTTITYTGNAVIDFTNCDVIFGRCAGFVFSGNARLRANNSVFRTCSETNKWTGMSFTENSTALVNECTFKNASTALSYTGSNTNAEIANNLFQNNAKAININNVTTFTGAINANTFELTNPQGAYNICYNSLPLNEFRMIDINNSVLQAPISQNRFYNRSSTFSGTSTYTVRGIIMNASTAYISQNSFSDMSESVLCNLKTNNKFMLIENNQIDVNKPNVVFSSQITVQNSYFVKILNNRLYNSLFTPGTSPASTGIYIDGNLSELNVAHNILIKDNKITGFDQGINSFKANNLSIIENEIINSRTYGIYSQSCKQIDFSCNKIDMDPGNKTPTVDLGIGMLVMDAGTNAGPVNKIQGNCIFDTRTAIWLQAASLRPLPLIRNNFLYNYMDNGILNSNYTGTIGTPAVAGINTFYSNSSNAGVLDINSAPIITARDNYITAAVVGVVLAGSLTMQSVASCGHQISGTTNQAKYDATLYCNDISNTVLYPVLSQGTELSIMPGFKGTVGEFKDQASYAMFKTNLALIASLDSNIAYALMNDINVNAEKLKLSKTELYSLQYSLEYEMKHWNKVLALIHTNELSSLLGTDNLELETLDINFRLGKALDAGSLAFLNDIMVNGDNGQKEKASGILRSYDLAAFQPYWNPTPIFYTPVNTPKTYNTSRNSVEVFPNPFQDEITIRIVNINSDNTHAEIYDLMGKKIENIDIQYKTNEIQVKTGKLAAGTYMVKIYDNGQLNETVKIVKIQ